MSEIGLIPEYRTWKVAGRQIEYPRATLDEINREVTEGYYRLPHGGVEVGGILFGLRDDQGVRIVTHRPVPCEYKRGPSYILSENDEAALADALESAKYDPAFHGFHPVGWYHSHTRQEICLTPVDIELYNRFFPERWQIAMVMRPASLQPTRVGFFFREGDGSLRTESSYHEFKLTPGRAVDDSEPFEETPALPAVVDAPAVKVETLPALSPRALTVVTDNGHITAETPARRRPWKWYAAFAALILANAAGVWWWLGPARTLSLAAADSSGQLQIRWNERAVRDASGASLEIVDGGERTQLNLDAADLHSGRLAYRRRSGNVLLHMTVRRSGGAVIEEATRFIDPRWSPAIAPPAAAAPEASPNPAPVVTAQTLPRPTPTSPPPADIPQSEPSQTTTDEQPVAETHPETASLQPPASNPQPPKQPAVNLQPVAPQTAKPQPPPPSPALPAPSARINTATLPAVPPIVEPLPAPKPPATKPAAPASGRIIWSGRLPKDGMLMLNGDRASTGTLTGALPGHPVRIQVYPADSDGRTATLYSADPKYVHKLIESAGPQTGNKKIVYTWDPLRAKAVKVLEPPASQNGWTHLVIHADRSVTWLVVEWSTVQ